MSFKQYRGRFAPSPTGQLHFGTLVAATGSYLQARSQQGEWLMRIEDVDTTRRVAGSDKSILQSLEILGFEWDGEETYQSHRTELYQQALNALSEQNLIYPCTCSRKQLTEENNAAQSLSLNPSVYPGTCREKQLPLDQEYALRLRVDSETIRFEDRVMGAYQQTLISECGDFIIQRRDHLFAYQLAVVVDDALQGITEVVRGADLLDSTPRQIYLQKLLAYRQPDYMHLPLVLENTQHKLSKSVGSAALNLNQPVKFLLKALNHLGQLVPADFEQGSLSECWGWARQNWNIQHIPKRSQIYNRQ